MTSRDFCYWLQGFFELTGPSQTGLSVSQVDCITKHLNMVFIHEIDPSMPNPKLDDAHTGFISPKPRPNSLNAGKARC